MNVRKIVMTLLLMFSIVEVAYANFCIDGHCQCVDYCKDNGYSDMSGNAYQWWDNSIGKYARGSTPVIGAVLVWKGWSKKNAAGVEIGNPAGHVAIVASIVSDGEITVNHANWAPTDVFYPIAWKQLIK